MLAPTDPTARALLGQVFVRYRRRILAHEQGTISGLDPEDLHKARTSSRRLRAALKLFKGVLPSTLARNLATELGWLGRLLGEVRDLDVQLEHLAQVQAQPPGPALASLESWLQQRRAQARLPMCHGLGTERYWALHELLGRAARADGPAGDKGRRSARALLVPRLQRRQAKLRRRCLAATEQTSDERLHRLRIQAKGLRYGLEFSRPLLGSAAAPAIGRVTALQDLLGAHQDAVVGIEVLLEHEATLDLPVEHAIRQDLARHVRRRHAEQEILRQRFLRELPELTAALGDPREPAGGSVAALLVVALRPARTEFP